MAKIENTIVYPIKTNVTGRDRVIITDIEDNNATKSANIGDITASINILETQVDIPSSAFYNLGTSVYTLITGVTDYLICPISILVRLNFVTTAYNMSVVDQVRVTTASAGGNAYSSQNAAFFNNPSSFTGSMGVGDSMGGFLPGESLVLFGGPGFTPPTTGDSTATMNIMYRLVKF